MRALMTHNRLPLPLPLPIEPLVPRLAFFEKREGFKARYRPKWGRWGSSRGPGRRARDSAVSCRLCLCLGPASRG
eukprot:4875720-Pleurochrysis_carterae.AAC.1